jgi:uncharacterized membrane protein YgcG
MLNPFPASGAAGGLDAPVSTSQGWANTAFSGPYQGPTAVQAYQGPPPALQPWGPNSFSPPVLQSAATNWHPFSPTHGPPQPAGPPGWTFGWAPPAPAAPAAPAAPGGWQYNAQAGWVAAPAPPPSGPAPAPLAAASVAAAAPPPMQTLDEFFASDPELTFSSKVQVKISKFEHLPIPALDAAAREAAGVHKAAAKRLTVGPEGTLVETDALSESTGPIGFLRFRALLAAYFEVLGMTAPHLAARGAEYIAVLLRLAARHGADSAEPAVAAAAMTQLIAYDNAARSAMSRSLTRALSAPAGSVSGVEFWRPSPQLEASCFTPLQCGNCRGPHMADVCPHDLRPAAAGGPPGPGSSSAPAELCFAFNGAGGCQRAACRRIHACTACGRVGLCPGGPRCAVGRGAGSGHGGGSHSGGGAGPGGGGGGSGGGGGGAAAAAAAP